VVNDMIQVLEAEDVLAYLDDFICYHENWDDHMAALDRILSLFKLSGFKLSGAKCSFAQREVTFLGHVVSAGYIKPIPQKVAIIQQWPVPKDASDLSRFLGLIGYYRKFIRDYAELSAILYDQLKCFDWTPACTAAFTKLQDLLVEEVTLKLPDPHRPFIVTCDASAAAVGYVLEQENDQGLRQPVAFGGRKLNARETRYSATELECLAAVEAVKAYRPYLLGTKFQLYTDHQAVRWLLQKKNAEGTAGRLWRWAHKLDEYEFEVHHKPGKTNIVADALSRVPRQAALVTIDDETSFLELKEAQDKDPDLLALRAELRKKRPSKGKFLNVIKRVGVDESTGLLTVDGTRIILPASLQRSALKAVHDNPTAGHPSAERTLCLTQDRFFWNGMRSDVYDWVKSCSTCQQRKPPVKKLRAPLGQMPLPSRPFEFVQVDLKVGLPRTPSGNQHILVVYDYFSKYI